MKSHRIVLGLLFIFLSLVVSTGVQATAPISDETFGFTSSGSDVGASASDVFEVVTGDLDGDGDLDIVSGSYSAEDYEIVAWQNDGTPFTGGTWSQQDVGSSTDDVQQIVLGDLDGDGDLDIASCSKSIEDNEVIVWENDGTPFDGLWTQQDVGASNASVYGVALGDLDGDGDLDVVTGSQQEEDFEVIAWQNDGSPFSGLWSQHNVGASTDHVWALTLGDLDNDGDLDIVTGSGSPAEDYEIIAWSNDGSPFNGLWAQNDVGASQISVWAVKLGDLDNDGDLDILHSSQKEADYEIIAWQNDGTPFSGLWIGNNVGASTESVVEVEMADMDNDGDLDIVSGNADSGGYQVVIWGNTGSPFTGLWEAHDVGVTDDFISALTVGDLDADGDLDIVSGTLAAGEDFEITGYASPKRSF